MKKFNIMLLALIAAFALCCIFPACDENGGTVDPVVITANDESFIYENRTLLDYMNYLLSKEELFFTVDDGMITSINGKSNTSKSYWMLYTSDTENANNGWGTYNNAGEIYGSAMFGAGTLAVKENCIYVWVYQTF